MAELVIAGAGPQALTLCCQLLQKRPQWRRQLRVLDPTGTWLSCWHSQMRRYEIPWLRSPSSHHPHPNPHALRRYAQERQRSLDLEGPYGLPHTSLFADFCRSVVADFQLGSHVQAASVQQIRLDQAGPASLEVTLSDGAVVAAHRLVIATGAGRACAAELGSDHRGSPIRQRPCNTANRSIWPPARGCAGSTS